MDDDLNTPQALAALFDLVNEGHRALESRGTPAAAAAIQETLLACGTTLGLFLQGVTEESPAVVQEVQARIEERDALRKAKQFKEADAIREALETQGFLLTDTAVGITLWRRAG